MVNSYSFSGMFSSITQTRAHQVRRNRRKIFRWEACTVAWVCLAPLCQNQRPELGERNIHLDLANSLVPGPIRYPNPMVYPMKICQNSLLMFVVFPHSMFARLPYFWRNWSTSWLTGYCWLWAGWAGRMDLTWKSCWVEKLWMINWPANPHQL